MLIIICSWYKLGNTLLGLIGIGERTALVSSHCLVSEPRKNSLVYTDSAEAVSVSADVMYLTLFNGSGLGRSMCWICQRFTSWPRAYHSICNSFNICTKQLRIPSLQVVFIQIKKIFPAYISISHLTDNFELQRVNLFLSPLFLAAHSSLINLVPLWHCSWWVSSGFTCVAKMLMSDFVDTRKNIKSETQSDVRRGWRLLGHEAERRFAWKITLSQNLWCIYTCAWTYRSIYTRMRALCSQDCLTELQQRAGWRQRLQAETSQNVCRSFSIAMGFSYTKSSLPHQFNMEGYFWR